MKKSIIAAGAASLALAAMPVVGVLAAPAGTITDTLNVNIPAGCTIVNNNSTTGGNGSAPALANNYTVEMHNGEFKTNIGAAAADSTSGQPAADNTIDVSCNTEDTNDPDAGWKLTAIGDGATGHKTDLYNETADKAIATGTAVSGTTSNWAMKVAKSANAGYATAWTAAANYAAVPSSETDVVTGAGSISNAFTMTYQVYVNQTQETGTYTGAVKYTLYNPAS